MERKEKGFPLRLNFDLESLCFPSSLFYLLLMFVLFRCLFKTSRSILTRSVQLFNIYEIKC